jgi:hypothetical protein
MSDFSPPPGETELIGPSWLHNGVMATGCLLLAFVMIRLGLADMKGAYWMAAFMAFSAAVFLFAHLPGATGIWVDREGFLVHDMYRKERFEWEQVGAFMVRRKLLGKSIDFSYVSPESGRIEARSLPRGLTGSLWGVAKRMNDWRAWAAEQDA